MRISPVTVLALVSSLSLVAWGAETIHVAPQGHAGAPGTAAEPVGSIEAAQQLVRQRLAAGATGGIRVEIAPGEYRLTKTLEFGPADASAECPVTYVGQPGETLLSGGHRVTGWRVAGEVWEAILPPLRSNEAELQASGRPTVRDLWVNGRRAVRARHPNQGYFRVESAGPDNRTSFAAVAADWLPFAQRPGIEVLLLHDWSVSRIQVAELDAASRTYRFRDPIGGAMAQFAITNFEPHPRYAVENAPELLDAPGEWYLDEATRGLQYKPLPGESIDELQVVVPKLTQLLRVRGEPGKPAGHLRFAGLRFAHTAFDLPPHGYAQVQSNWHERRSTSDDSAMQSMMAAVELSEARDCEFARCEFLALAACGMHLRESDSCRVTRCDFRDIGGDGVLIGAIDPAKLPVAADITVADCTIERCGVSFAGAVGIWVGFAKQVAIEHNELTQLPYTGISVGWQWNHDPSPCQGHAIRGNHIHHIMQELSDGGGIYTLGLQPGTQLTDNYIHHVPVNAGRAESNGIFMDEGSSAMVVRGNVIHNIARSPIRFHRAGANEVRENLLVAPTDSPTLQFNNCPQELIHFHDNREQQADDWVPPASETTVMQAGPRPAA